MRNLTFLSLFTASPPLSVSALTMIASREGIVIDGPNGSEIGNVLQLKRISTLID